ncbi:MAG TPA: hypothetical protein VEW07_06325 [Solirubrobacterales bacterium]|nr:hypothetical protein [Solirubrobacterales bacterium]
MTDLLTEAHIEGEKRLRESLIEALARIWQSLPGYDRENVDEWLSKALLVVLAAQRQSVALTNAYLARAMERQPLGLDLPELTGAGVRNGAAPEAVYERPFVTVWSALGAGTDWEQSVQDGLARATSTGAMDTQLSMRAAAMAIEEADTNLFGFRRVANPEACIFCKEVDGAYVKGADGFVMGLHNHCGCGLEALREPHPGAVKLPDGTEIRAFAYGPLNDNVALEDHGELGPVLVDPNQHFTSQAELAYAHSPAQHSNRRRTASQTKEAARP